MLCTYRHKTFDVLLAGDSVVYLIHKMHHVIAFDNLCLRNNDDVMGTSRIKLGNQIWHKGKL